MKIGRRGRNYERRLRRAREYLYELILVLHLPLLVACIDDKPPPQRLELHF